MIILSPTCETGQKLVTSTTCKQWHIKFSSQLLVNAATVTSDNGWAPLTACTFAEPRARHPITRHHDVTCSGNVNIF